MAPFFLIAGFDTDDLNGVTHRFQLDSGYPLKIAITFASTLATVAVMTYMQTPVYESVTILLVRFGRAQVYRPEVADLQAYINRDRESVTNAELQILRSHGLIKSVVATLGTEKLYPELAEKAPSKNVALRRGVARFKASFEVLAMENSDVIRVSFQHSDPELTAQALNLLVHLFKDKHVETFSDPDATAFLEEKVAEYRRELHRSEEELKIFQLDNKAFSITEHQKLLFLQRGQLEADLKDARSQTDGLRQKLKYLESEQARAFRDPAVLAASRQSKPGGEAKAELLELQLEEQESLLRFQATDRQVSTVRKKIGLVQSVLTEQESSAPHTGIVYELEEQILKTVAELRFQEATSRSIERQLDELGTELANLPLLEAKLRDLSRERKNKEKNYETYLTKLEEARISEEMDPEKLANISVIPGGAGSLRAHRTPEEAQPDRRGRPGSVFRARRGAFGRSHGFNGW